MRNHRLLPCIWLDDQAEQAAALSARTFPGGRITATSRYPASGGNPAGRPPGSVLTVEVELAGLPFTLLNGGPMFKPTPSLSFFVHVDAPGAAAGEGPEGTVKHGRFLLTGQNLVAMDAHGDHGFGFTEGLSRQVTCQDQATLDRYRAALGEAGTHGPCGWLEDRYGLSWQVVPTSVTRWLTGGDAAARERAFAAMPTMGKLDVAALERAFGGG